MLFTVIVFYQFFLLCGNTLGALVNDGILVCSGISIRRTRTEDKDRVVLAPASSRLRCFAKCARDPHCSKSVRFNHDGAMEEVVKEVRNGWHPHADDYVLKCVNRKEGRSSIDRHLLQPRVIEISPPTKQDIQKYPPLKMDTEQYPPTGRNNGKYPLTEKGTDESPLIKQDIHKSPPTKQDIIRSPTINQGIEKSLQTKQNINQSPPTKKDMDQFLPTNEGINQSKPTKRDNDKYPPTKKDIDQSTPTRKDISQSAPTEKVITKSSPIKQDINRSPSVIQNADKLPSSTKDGDTSAPHTQESGRSHKKLKTHGSSDSKTANARNKLTSKEIPTTDIPSVPTEAGAVSVAYKVETETGKTDGSDTDSYVYLTLHGVNDTDELYLNNVGAEMRIGYVDTFHIVGKKDLGTITKMEIRMEKYLFLGVPWFCVRLEVERQTRYKNYTKVDVYSSSLNRWFPEGGRRWRLPFETPHSIPFNLTKTFYKT